MACFLKAPIHNLKAPIHYLNQNWFNIKEVRYHSPGSNFTGNAQDLNQYKTCFKTTFLKLQYHPPVANESMGSTVCYPSFIKEQGKSQGFESCDRPIVRKRPIWVKMGDVLSRVTLKFDGWPWKMIGHLSFAVSSFVQHFIVISEFKLELLSGNTQFGSNSTFFRAVWPWNLMYDLEKQ